MLSVRVYIDRIKTSNIAVIPCENSLVDMLFTMAKIIYIVRTMIIFFNEFCRKRKKKVLGNFCTRNKLKKAVMIFKNKILKNYKRHFFIIVV